MKETMESILPFLKEYLSVIVAILASFFTYLFGRKKENYSFYINQAKEGLENITGPIYYNLKYILEIENDEQKMNLILKWFSNTLADEAPLYQLGNKKIINDFLELKQAFYKENKLKLTEDFQTKLSSFYKIIEERYWTTFNALYRDFDLIPEFLMQVLHIELSLS
ncbi:hypothetical protein GA0061096_4372 [Fictibacillus enclensis]|uniref:Uncharacterized protein n=1 Tax=Fictibacillus enclensis TaxID=1017270 RepID=A0A0V8J013_9BACL|nr:hypothetical protein [Fictibacillus enclensis]KSU80380.1 hypothetical protein AS030_20840 [Fictibacillus enclensis]SCC38688.1 hypothetical protein GA0061096_4372 [Fictibacillus enclensis]